MTLATSSVVKMSRKNHSVTSSTPAFQVPGGSSGDSHAMVAQLARMMVRMKGSNQRASTSRMAAHRGWSDGRSQHSEVL